MDLNSTRQMSGAGAETDPLTVLRCQRSCPQYILSLLSFSVFTDTHAYPRTSTHTHTRTPLLFFIFPLHTMEQFAP